jgi:hypothetical protein
MLPGKVYNAEFRLNDIRWPDPSTSLRSEMTLQLDVSWFLFLAEDAGMVANSCGAGSIVNRCG